MRKKHHTKWSLLFFILLLFICLLVPIPYYIEGPGAAVHLNELVTVNKKEDKKKGSYMLTTVSIQHATPITYFKQYLPFHEGLTKDELFGTSGSSQEYNNLQNYYMTSSINGAIQSAYKLAGEKYDFQYNGVYVMSILPGSKFDTILNPGDTILSIDGNRFKSSQDFIEYVQKQKAGQEVSVTFEREGKQQQKRAKLIKMKETKKPGLGIGLVDDTSITTDIPVSIDAGSIGGPSAGFMFALQVYTQLKNADLRNGKEIAGTGTIDNNGTIGRIGGIDKKVVAADKEGAEVFFAPNDKIPEDVLKNYPELTSNYKEAVAAAKKIHTDMKIVPVTELVDAVNYFRK